MIANRHMRICCVASAPLIAFVLIFASSISPAHAVEDARKVSIVSFGLFGDQGVFKSEATGAAQVVANRFGNGPIKVQYNSKRGGGATIEGLATSLQVASNGMDAENDVLFLILTSHGSRAGLAVKAGRLTQTLTPSYLADMLARTGGATQGGGHLGLLFRSLHPPSREPRYAGHHCGRCRPSVVRLPRQGQVDLFRRCFFHVALRQAKNLKDAFVVARALVQKRELREHFEPSSPQMAGGANVQPFLIARP